MPHMTTVHDTPGAFSCHPIAFVRSPYARRIDAPHQSTVVAGTETQAAAEAVIEFVADFPAAAWRDLAGFERIWLLFAFHRSEGWKAEVRPPRGGGKRSVLATRSPHRPNAIGLSAVELVTVEEGWPYANVGTEVAMQVTEAAWDWLDAPPVRVTGKDIPMPYAANLEKLALPTVPEIVAAVRGVTYK